MNFHSFLRVEHPALKIVRACKAINERTESDALHHASHLDGISVRHLIIFRRHRRGLAIPLESLSRPQRVMERNKVAAPAPASARGLLRRHPRHIPRILFLSTRAIRASRSYRDSSLFHTAPD